MSVDSVQKTGVQLSAPRDQRQQVAQLAQEFEAMLMTQMLREMRSSMLDEESRDGGLGLSAMTDTMDIALGQALSRVGGFGLTRALGSKLGQSLGVEDAAGAPVSAAGAAARRNVLTDSTSGSREIDLPGVDAPAGDVDASTNASSDGEGLQVPTGAITSSFGWRHDPFNRAVKFHKGIDVAQPYGQDVRAAGSGRVIASGERGDYGVTIVVDHGGGQQTRYAHLSALSVQVGDRVEAGQVIGKVGDSGRATGPHLHFEVTENGRAVNPLGL